MRASPVVFFLLISCGPAPADYGPLEVWPSQINLGMTADGVKFKAPAGASGGDALEWKVQREDKPRASIKGNDVSAILTSEYPGADELIVTSVDGQEISIPITVISYPIGSMQRGEAAIERIGCRESGCHDAAGPDFTPSRIAGFDDREVANWILRGTSLKDGRTVPNHAWPLTIEEEADVVARLRSLPPKGGAVKQ